MRNRFGPILGQIQIAMVKLRQADKIAKELAAMEHNLEPEKRSITLDIPEGATITSKWTQQPTIGMEKPGRQRRAKRRWR